MHYFVVKLAGKEKPALIGISNGKAYLEGSMRDEIPRDQVLEALQDYGEECSNNGDMFDRYLMDYPIQPLEQLRPGVCGFVAPDGRVFDCEYFGHSSLAYDILMSLYKDTHARYKSTENVLIKEHGWIALRYATSTPNYDLGVTEAQRATVLKLQELDQTSPDKNIHKRFRWLLDDLELFGLKLRSDVGRINPDK